MARQTVVTSFIGVPLSGSDRKRSNIRKSLNLKLQLSSIFLHALIRIVALNWLKNFLLTHNWRVVVAAAVVFAVAVVVVQVKEQIRGKMKHFYWLLQRRKGHKRQTLWQKIFKDIRYSQTLNTNLLLIETIFC